MIKTYDSLKQYMNEVRINQIKNTVAHFVIGILILLFLNVVLHVPELQIIIGITLGIILIMWSIAYLLDKYDI